MERQRRIKPCKDAVWSEARGRWELPNNFQPKKNRPIPIRRQSKKRAREDRIYNQKRKWFLALEENAVCPVAKVGLIPDIYGTVQPHHRAATTVHHAWRRGRYYLEEATWIGASFEGHCWIELNPDESRKRGWLCDTEETRTKWRNGHGGLPLQ